MKECLQTNEGCRNFHSLRILSSAFKIQLISYSVCFSNLFSYADMENVKLNLKLTEKYGLQLLGQHWVSSWTCSAFWGMPVFWVVWEATIYKLNIGVQHIWGDFTALLIIALWGVETLWLSDALIVFLCYYQGLKKPLTLGTNLCFGPWVTTSGQYHQWWLSQDYFYYAYFRMPLGFTNLWHDQRSCSRFLHDGCCLCLWRCC